MSDLPSGPWKDLSADFCGPLPTGEYLFIIIDEYSRYPIVEIIRSVSAKTVIPVLDKVLSQFGYPQTIKLTMEVPLICTSLNSTQNMVVFVRGRLRPDGQERTLKQNHSISLS